MVMENDLSLRRETMPGHGTHARHVLDDVVKEGEAGLRCALTSRQVCSHDFLLRLHELLHHAEVFLHQRRPRVGGSRGWGLGGGGGGLEQPLRVLDAVLLASVARSRLAGARAAGRWRAPASAWV